MGPFRLKCNICGAPIGGEHHVWLNEFRAVYSNGHEWSFPRLSGVGFRLPNRMDTSEVQAPIDSLQRYGGPAYEKSDGEVPIVGMSPMYEEDNLASPLGDPNDLAQYASWGYLFHDACWRLLVEACYPANINIRVLNDFCRSFPIRVDVIDWGHDYGGIFETSSTGIPPGGAHWLGHMKKVRRTRENNYSADEIFHADPIHIPLLDLLLKETVGKQNFGKSVSQPRRSLITDNEVDAQRDCFKTLSPELREMILLHLSSADVRNVFLASRIFARSSLSQAFWASRFQQNLEFSSLFEARRGCEVSPGSHNWRSLFQGLRRCTRTLNFQNRNRIWSIIQPLADAIITFSNISLSGKPRHTFFDPDINDDGLQWKSAQGYVSESKRRLGLGCRILFSRSVNVPSTVVAVYVSTIKLEAGEFVTGLRLLDAHGVTSNVGYILSGREVRLAVQSGNADHADNDGLRGFNLAIAADGIQAVAVVSATGKISSWAGSPQNTPRMRLLSCSKLEQIKCDFDGLKLVSLSIPEDKSRRKSSQSVSLRDNIQWIPDIPPENLYLNEKSFQPVDCFTGPYWPLIWIHFGGFQGAHLQYVIAVSAWVLDGERCTGIEVEYDREVQGARVQTLGICHPVSDDDKSALSPKVGMREEKVIFNIDGPNGEYLSAVRVGISEISHSLNFFEVSTNYGRSNTFLDGTGGSDTSLPAVTACEKSTAITGFYAKTNLGIAALGVVSEPISC